MKYSLPLLSSLIILNLSFSCLTMENLPVEGDFEKSAKGRCTIEKGLGAIEPNSQKRKRASSLSEAGGEQSKIGPSTKIRAIRPGKNLNEFTLNAEKINAILARKAEVLIKVLPVVSKSLEEISLELGTRSRALKDHDSKRASELAVTGSLGMSLRHSAEGIMGKLNTPKSGKKAGFPPMTSIAIGASGALKQHIIEFISKLESSEDTHIDNLKNLKEAMKEISSITDDIDKGDFVLSDEK